MDLIVHNEIVPAVNQIETHPFYQRWDAAEFLEEYDIQHQSWGPFAEGQNNIFDHDVLTSIGDQYDKTAAQVTLRWLLQRDIVAIPNPSTTVDRRELQRLRFRTQRRGHGSVFGAESTGESVHRPS